MAKKIELASTMTISKSPAYKDLVIVLDIDKEREDQFNANKKIEVSQKELSLIGNHRWLIKE